MYLAECRAEIEKSLLGGYGGRAIAKLIHELPPYTLVYVGMNSGILDEKMRGQELLAVLSPEVIKGLVRDNGRRIAGYRVGDWLGDPLLIFSVQSTL